MSVIRSYIYECDEVLESRDSERASKLIDKIVSVFGNQIKNIEQGLDTFSYHLGEREYDYLGDVEKLRDKLSLFLTQSKSNQLKPTKEPSIVFNNNNANTNTNTNTNTVNLSVLFQNTRNEIENDGSLSEQEIQEILLKIDEIEKISKSNDPKNKKWFALRPTMEWLGTKGVTVAVSILNLISAVLAAA